MNRRAFLRALAATPVAIALAPLVAKTQEWRPWPKPATPLKDWSGGYQKSPVMWKAQLLEGADARGLRAALLMAMKDKQTVSGMVVVLEGSTFVMTNRDVFGTFAYGHFDGERVTVNWKDERPSPDGYISISTQIVNPMPP